MRTEVSRARLTRQGPKRLRRTRRETSPVSRQGYLPGVSNFKRERLSKLLTVEWKEQSV